MTAPSEKSDWIEIPGGAFLLGLTDEETAILAELNAKLARAQYEPDPLHGLREDQALEERWGNADHLADLLAFSRPAHEVEFTPFAISPHPVTVAEYREFVAATGAPAPKRTGSATEQQDWPVTGITWHEADAYARWRGCVLPTEAQWERAARGSGRRLFPWGNAWGGAGARLDAEVERVRIRTRKAMASTDGVHEMVSYLHEWCADEFGPYPGADARACGRVPSPPGGWTETRVRRSGAHPGLIPCAVTRRGAHADVQLGDTTFRLVR